MISIEAARRYALEQHARRVRFGDRCAMAMAMTIVLAALSLMIGGPG